MRVPLLVVLVLLATGCRIKRRADDSDAGAMATASATASAIVASAAPSASLAAPVDAAPPEPVEPPEGALVIALGGVGSLPRQSDAVLAAVDDAIRELVNGRAPIEAAARAVALLEDHPELNAGTGSSWPIGAPAPQMDAAVMDSEGRFGAVAAISDVRNPVLVARMVADTPHLVLAGKAAVEFARRRGFAPYEVTTDARRSERTRLLGEIDRPAIDGGSDAGFPWSSYVDRPKVDHVDAGAALDGGAANLPPISADAGSPPADTVMLLLRDPEGRFAAAASSGGPALALAGRVGDVPVLGAALYVGRAGAVAVSGNAELVVREMLARRVYERMRATRSAKLALAWAKTQWPKDEPLALVAIDALTGAFESNVEVAWARRSARGSQTGAPPPVASAAASATAGARSADAGVAASATDGGKP